MLYIYIYTVSIWTYKATCLSRLSNQSIRSTSIRLQPRAGATCVIGIFRSFDSARRRQRLFSSASIPLSLGYIYPGPSLEPRLCGDCLTRQATQCHRTQARPGRASDFKSALPALPCWLPSVTIRKIVCVPYTHQVHC